MECRTKRADGKLGAYEASLIGTKRADPEQPLEISRTIHSFDPCIACAVHSGWISKGKRLSVYESKYKLFKVKG